MANGILVIEDEVTLGNNIRKYLGRHGHEVRIARDGQHGLLEFNRFSPDVLVLDYQLPDMNGIDVLRKVIDGDPQVKVIMMTAHGSTAIAVEAMKIGACDYLSKPVVLSELKIAIDKAVGQDRLENRLTYYQQQEASRSGLGRLLGSSPEMTALREEVSRLLRAEAGLKSHVPPAVLVTGETGTGKELVVRALHFDSVRRDGPFIELNCSAIPENLIESELFGHERGAYTDAKIRKLGLIEAADGGTLFLDEVGELPAAAQVKLLKVLEDQTVRRIGSIRDRQVSVRIASATNRSLEQLIEDGRFRSDLYFRLKVIEFRLPPLRVRHGDIVALAVHFLSHHSARYGRPKPALNDGARRKLKSYGWPGNVRELSNVMERAVLLSVGDEIGPEHLALSQAIAERLEKPRHSGQSLDAVENLPLDGVNLRNMERKLVLQALERTSWNISKAARLLGLSRDTMRYRIEKYELTRGGEP